MKIIPLPAFKDNYIWVIIDDLSHAVIVIDPGDAHPVLNFLNKNNFILKSILITHKHQDHTGGISQLLSVHPDISVFSHQKEKVAGTTQFVSDNDIIKINQHSFKVIEIPGHTLGHVAYYSHPYLFCGDTLFTGGCGRVFEGTADQMVSSLKKLMLLPDDTKIYCGHEYTLNNLKFALQVEPNNNALRKRFEITQQMRAENKVTVPSTMALEKFTNPFLRCDSPEIIQTVSSYAKKILESDVKVFYEMREWKNKY